MNKEINAFYHSVAANLNLSDCAFWILYTLHESKDTLLKQSDLSENMSIPPQTVNSALKKLELDGYVCLKQIEGKMGKSIHLTKKGMTFIADNIVPVAAAEEKVCESFSGEEAESFLNLFRLLVSRLYDEINDTQRQ